MLVTGAVGFAALDRICDVRGVLAFMIMLGTHLIATLIAAHGSEKK
jgi:hypothetical protein